MTQTATRRGSSNRNERGSSTSRRIRRAWLMETYASDVKGLTRCYRCGYLLHNPDDYEGAEPPMLTLPLTIDRIFPGVQGGRYTRDNIRPACGPCNSLTGGGLHG